MKLSKSLLFTAVGAAKFAADWEQPTYLEILNAVRTKNGFDWGHPVDPSLKASANWELCPALNLPDNAESVQCNGSTCAVICTPGYQPDKSSGLPRRTKCRWNRRRGFFWKKELAPCVGCEPEDPAAAITDTNIETSCEINGKKNRRICKFTCANGMKFGNGRGKIKAKCKCARRQGCGWFVSKTETLSNFSSLACFAAGTETTGVIDAITVPDASEPVDKPTDVSGDLKPPTNGTELTDTEKPINGTIDAITDGAKPPTDGEFTDGDKPLNSTVTGEMPTDIGGVAIDSDKPTDFSDGEISGTNKPPTDTGSSTTADIGTVSGSEITDANKPPSEGGNQEGDKPTDFTETGTTGTTGTTGAGITNGGDTIPTDMGMVTDSAEGSPNEVNPGGFEATGTSPQTEQGGSMPNTQGNTQGEIMDMPSEGNTNTMTNTETNSNGMNSNVNENDSMFTNTDGNMNTSTNTNTNTNNMDPNNMNTNTNANTNANNMNTNTNTNTNTNDMNSNTSSMSTNEETMNGANGVTNDMNSMNNSNNVNGAMTFGRYYGR